MHVQCKWLLKLIPVILMLSILGACNYPGMTSPTPTPAPTNTAEPPTPTTPPTATPTTPPTASPTSPPTPTSGPTLPPPTLAPPPTATGTPTAENAVLVYYFKLDENGRYGCGEQVYWLNTGIARTGNIVNDVTAALRWLFSYKNENIGELYNPYHGSNFAVGSIEQRGDSGINVYLTGEYVPTGEKCDPTRLRDQIKLTIQQFPGTGKLNILLNGTALGDALSRKQ
jgi:hypothetical protein